MTLYRNDPHQHHNCNVYLNDHRAKTRLKNANLHRKNHTLSSASKGRWRRISSGSVSAAITTNSEIPLFRVFVAASKKHAINNYFINITPPPTIKKKKKKKRLNIQYPMSFSIYNNFFCSCSTFIGTFLELLIISSLLDEVQNRYSKLSISKRVCFWIHSFGGLQ